MQVKDVRKKLIEEAQELGWDLTGTADAARLEGQQGALSISIQLEEGFPKVFTITLREDGSGPPMRGIVRRCEAMGEIPTPREAAIALWQGHF
jgi:hypothetical protein